MRIIRKEIVIHAPPAEVWEHITDPAKIAGWLMPNTFGAKVGKRYTMDCGRVGPITGVVKEVIPHKRLVYSWTSPVIKKQTTVTITLIDEKGSTRLILEHSGWEAPPAEQDIPDLFGRGWDEHLKALVDQLAAASKR